VSLDNRSEEVNDDTESLKYANLVMLSGITGSELDVFLTHWGNLAEEQQQKTLNRLLELAEDNLDVDFSTIFRSCLRDTNPQTREKAISGLWECDDRTLILPLINLLNRDDSNQVRAAAASALGKFAALAAEEKLLQRDIQRIQEALLDAIEHTGSQQVKCRAIESIGCFTTEVVNKIIRDAYEDEDPSLRCSAIHAMGSSCELSWLPTIFNELDNPYASIRYEVANACGEIGAQTAIPHLTRLLKDEDQQVQVAAIQALESIGGKDARQVLSTYLKSADEVLVETIEESLQNLENEDGPIDFKFDAQE
jgi:HEAT repeat protein